MKIHIYNTLSEEKELLKKPKFKKLKLFVCGPTVYDQVHIGNFRTSVVFDIFVRYLRAHDYKIRYLQNITDIDDKIIDKAEKEHKSWKEIARKYEKNYLEISRTLNIQSVDSYPRATDHIKQIVAQVQRLIRKGYAYEIENDGWYFNIRKFPDYGKLAKRTLQQAEDGVSRIDESQNKKNRGDFALWKFSKEESATNVEGSRNGEPGWETQLGYGRPGWHIEDTAITEKYFGPQYDIHGGGLDLKFPHHEAEIAQQESASGKSPFVKLWMHSGLLNFQGSKMSKSKGNFITISDFLKNHTANTFRFMVFSNHYRSPMEFSPSVAADAEKNLRSISLLLAKLKLIKNQKGKTIAVEPYSKSFMEAMNDDLNSPKALASIFSLVNLANKEISNLSTKSAREISRFLEEVFSTLGFFPLSQTLPKNVSDLLKKRELSRINKQFDQSDILRDEIEKLGYILEDTALGAVAIPKNI